MALQIRRGTEAERTAGGGVVFAEGELIYVTDTDALYIGDGSTAGGVLLASDALADISAMLTANTIDDQLELEKEAQHVCQRCYYRRTNRCCCY